MNDFESLLESGHDHRRPQLLTLQLQSNPPTACPEPKLRWEALPTLLSVLPYSTFWNIPSTSFAHVSPSARFAPSKIYAVSVFFRFAELAGETNNDLEENVPISKARALLVGCHATCPVHPAGIGHVTREAPPSQVGALV
jgi:hypothetical protein